MVKPQPNLTKRISTRKARIGVVGLGYVGMPLAVGFAEEGFSVIGLDKAQARITPLLNRTSTVEGIEDIRISRLVDRKKLTPLEVSYLPANASEPLAEPELDPNLVDKLLGLDIFIICVQTPLRKSRGWEPELKWIKSAYQLIETVSATEARLGRLPKERLIVLESTTYPGTTRSVFEKLLKEYNQKPDLQWYLAYSPERTDPGPRAHLKKTKGKLRATRAIPRIVAGLDVQSRDIASLLYHTVFKEMVPVSPLETGEMIKLVENAFRFVSIAFANEMAPIAKAYGLNIWEIIEGAKTKGFGLDLCFPGLIGGHCIPIDPHYLGSAARKEGQVATLIDAAEKIHQETNRDARDLIHRLLIQQDKGVRGSKILFFGIAYKKNVRDFREAPSLTLMKELVLRGAECCYWDPRLGEETIENSPYLSFNQKELRKVPAKLAESLGPLEGLPNDFLYLQVEEIKGAWEELRHRILTDDFDCIVLATDHDDFLATYQEMMLSASTPPIADLRNAINTWLSGKEKPSKRVIAQVKQTIAQPQRYMLLGVD